MSQHADSDSLVVADQEKVQALMDSIADIGLQEPVSARKAQCH